MKRMMKQHHSWNSMLKACAMLFVSVFCLTSCYNDDDIKNDISDLRSRVTSLEEWQKSVNSDIQAIQTIVEALQKQNFITAVTPFSGGGETGYTIAFHSGETINIRNGKDGKNGTDGKSPDLSVKEDIDGVYYWTVNGNFLTDAAGNKMPVTGPKGEKGDKGDQGDKGDNGDKGETGAQGEKGQTGETGSQGESGTSGNHAIAPKLQISDSNVWQISTDDGKTWKDMTDSKGNPIKATGDKGEQGENGIPGKDGDSFFAEKDPVVVSDNYVTFTLKDGTTTFTLPRTNGISINFGTDIVYYQGSQYTFKVNINNLTADNYQAIYAEIKNSEGHATSIITRDSSPTPTELSQIIATLSPDYKTVEIELDRLSEESDGSILKLTVVTNDNKEISSSVLLQHKTPVYTIKSKEDWINLTNSYKFKYNITNPELSELPIVNLEADIDFGGATIQPLGMDVNSGYARLFQGTFNGNGHTIKNFKIDQQKSAGLFGNLAHPNFINKRSTISNLIIEGAEISGYGDVGIVTADIGGCTVSNVKIRNSKATAHKGSYSMGLGCICGEAGRYSNHDPVTLIYYTDKPEILNCSFENCTLSYNSDELGSFDQWHGVGEIYGYCPDDNREEIKVITTGTSTAGVTINKTTDRTK